MSYLDEMVIGYIECALWSGLDTSRCDAWKDHEDVGCTDECRDGNNPPLDANYGADDLSPEALAKITADCEAFLAAAKPEDISFWEAGQAGHDFCLTRGGHGTGFWDRGYGDPPKAAAGERLTALCGYGTPLPPLELFAGADDLLYPEFG